MANRQASGADALRHRPNIACFNNDLLRNELVFRFDPRGRHLVNVMLLGDSIRLHLNANSNITNILRLFTAGRINVTRQRATIMITLYFHRNSFLRLGVHLRLFTIGRRLINLTGTKDRYDFNFFGHLTDVYQIRDSRRITFFCGVNIVNPSFHRTTERLERGLGLVPYRMYIVNFFRVARCRGPVGPCHCNGGCGRRNRGRRRALAFTTLLCQLLQNLDLHVYTRVILRSLLGSSTRPAYLPGEPTYYSTNQSFFLVWV